MAPLKAAKHAIASALLSQPITSLWVATKCLIVGGKISKGNAGALKRCQGSNRSVLAGEFPCLSHRANQAFD